MKKFNFLNRGQTSIEVIIALVLALLIGGSLYYYLSKQFPEVPEITKKPAAEEEVTLPPEEELPEEEATPEEEVPPEEEVKVKKPEIEKPEINKPEVEITARPAEISNKNSPISTVFGIMVALAQEFETGKELQVEIRYAPPKEMNQFQTWSVGYTIKNTTDSSFYLAYNIEPLEYKTSGAVVVDPDGEGPKKWFYYTFGEEVLLLPKSEQHFDLSLSPPEGLTEITPRMVFKGFSTEKPLFTHEFTVRVIYVPPPAECETPSTCPVEGYILFWGGGYDDFLCPNLQCISPESKTERSEHCWRGVTTSEGEMIVEKCQECAIINPEGVCAESISIECNDKLPPKGWRMVDKCPD